MSIPSRPEPPRSAEARGAHAAWVLRFGLLTAAVVGWSGANQLWEAGDTVGHDLSLALMLVTWIGSSVLLIFAALRSPPARAVWGIPVVLLLVFLDFAAAHRVHQRAHGLVVTTDVLLYNDYAARLIRHGENPYRHDLRPAYGIHRATQEYATPLLNAGLTGRLPYPALSPLLFVPFQWLGLSTAWVYPLFLLLTAAALWWGAPRDLRPLVLLPLFAEQRFLLYSLGGVSDVVWAFFLVMTVASWEHRVGRGVWFGLACAFKQTPWLLAPFLVIRLWHESGGSVRRRLRETAVFAGAGAAPFLIVNLPFLLSDGPAWLRGVAEPFRADLITFGQGLSSLTTTGHVVFPKAYLTIFMLGALAVLVFAYARHFDRLRELLWIAPGLVLWLGNRSLCSYWYYGVIPLTLALARSWGRPEAVTTAPAAGRDWRPAALAAGVLVVFVGASALRFASTPPAFEMRVRPPILTQGEWAHRLEVEVHNRSGRPVRPRFAVQSWTNQPFFWTVEHGPPALAPEDGAVYRLRTDVPHEMFLVRRGARLTMADADVYHLRATVEIPPELGSAFPGAVPNGELRFWTGGPEPGGALQPLGWKVVEEPAGAGTAVAVRSGEGAVRLALPRASADAFQSVRLETVLMFPEDPIDLLVRPPPAANRLPEPDLLYGLELESEERRILVLFGDGRAAGELEPGVPYRTIPAPRGAWTQVTLDVREIFATPGSEPLPLRYRAHDFPALDFPQTSLRLRLLVAARRQTGAVEAEFGELRSVALRPDPERLFRRESQRPERWLLWSADVDFEARNFEAAKERYLEVVLEEPDFAPAHYRLAETEFWLGSWDNALIAFRRSMDLGYDRASATKGMAWSQLNAGRHDEALALFDAALALYEARNDPDEALHAADCHKGRWLIYLAKAECVAAEAAKSRAGALAPNLYLSVPEERNCASGG